MRYILFFLVLLMSTSVLNAQQPDPIPNSPAEQNVWLYSHLVIDFDFNVQKLANVKEKLNAISTEQLSVLVHVYDLKRKADPINKVASLARAKSIVDLLNVQIQADYPPQQQILNQTQWYQPQNDYSNNFQIIYPYGYTTYLPPVCVHRRYCGSYHGGYHGSYHGSVSHAGSVHVSHSGHR